MKRIGLILSGLLITISTTCLRGQDQNSQLVKTLVEENMEELEALSLYPDNLRDAILELTLHPELIVKLKTIKQMTEESFRNQISHLPEADQSNLWELTKYPGLIASLSDEKITHQEEAEIILKKYPAKIKEMATNYWIYDQLILKEIYEIEKMADKAFEELIVSYPENVREATRLLLDYPEVLHILTEHLDLAIIVGDIYKKDPEMVKRKADSIRMEASARYDQELESWRKGLEEDPEALKEFQEAAKEFSQEEKPKNYDPMYPDLDEPDSYQGEEEVVAGENENYTITYRYYYYPFWFGYPYWYYDYYWMGHPFWFHWGFYYGPERNIVIVSGLPSYYFVYWYFDAPYHHYKYPHFSEYVIRHYRNQPRPSRTGLSAAIEQWETRDKGNVRSDLLRKDISTEKLRDYGRFEERYQKNVSKDSGVPVSRDRYLEQNRNRYPYLSGENKAPMDRTRTTWERNYQIQSAPANRTGTLKRAMDLHFRTWDRNIVPGRQSIPKQSPASPVRKPRKKNN